MVAERSPHHPKTEGYSPAAVADTWKDKLVNKLAQLAAGSHRKMINNGNKKSRFKLAGLGQHSGRTLTSPSQD
jgi:hypothetical protein